MTELLLKFNWLMEFPYGDCGYDSKTKVFYVGTYDDRCWEFPPLSKKVGSYLIYHCSVPTTITYYDKPRYLEIMVIVDKRTHEIGFVNPFHRGLTKIDILKELEKV